MKKFLKEAWQVLVERAKIKKALRILSKQAWSTEYLVYLVCRATKVQNQGVYLIVKNVDGQEVHIRTETPVQNNFFKREEGLDVLSQNVSLEAVLAMAEKTGEM